MSSSHTSLNIRSPHPARAGRESEAASAQRADAAIQQEGVIPAQASDILEAAKDKKTFIQRASLFTTTSTAPDDFHLERKVPTGIRITPPRGPVPKRFSKTLAEPSHPEAFSLHTSPASLTWLSTKERAHLMHKLNRVQVQVSIGGLPSQTLAAGAAYVLSANGQAASRGDVASLIASDPVRIIPELQNTTKHQLLTEPMIPSVASQIAIASRIDLDGEQLEAVLALQFAVRDLVADRARHFSFLKGRTMTAADLEQETKQLSQQICEKTFHDVKKLCLSQTLTIEQALQALAIANTVVPGALRILGAQINNRDAAVQNLSKEVADLIVGTALRMGLVTVTHGLSELVNLATKRVAEKALDRVVEFFVGVAVPVRATVADDAQYRAFFGNLNAQVNSMKTRPAPEERRRAKLLRLYAEELEAYWKSPADRYKEIRIAESAALAAQASARRDPGFVGVVKQGFDHLRRRT